MSDKYILEGKKAVPCDDLMKWGKWFQTEDRTVKKTYLDGVEVSTVFLGLDHSYNGGKPMIFETMVFTDLDNLKDLDQNAERCSTWDEAEKMHQDMVNVVNSRLALTINKINKVKRKEPLKVGIISPLGIAGK